MYVCIPLSYFCLYMSILCSGRRGDSRRRDMHEMDKFETPTTDQDKHGTLTIRNNSTNNSYNSTNNDYNDCNDYNDYNDYNSNNDYNDYNSNNEYNL